MRDLLKGLVESAVCGSGLPRALRSGLRGRTIVLAYHNIVPDGAAAVGDRSLHLSQREFARQLDLLQRTHEVVPLSELLSVPQPAQRPRAVITFDDAYRGAVTAGVAELARRRLPATIFVAPAFLGGSSFWWDALAGPGGLSDEVREHGLDALQGKDAAIREWAVQRGVTPRSVPSHQVACSEEELDAAAATAGITLGSHTWSHVNLARVHGAELDGELTRPLAWLRARYGEVLPWITYPYGLSSPEVHAASARAGYVGGLRVEGGWMPRGAATPDPLTLPRLNVAAGLSLRGFELRVSGLLRRERGG